MSIQVNLRIPEQMYRKLQEQLRLFSYSTVQEVIIDTIREKYFRQTHTPTGRKRGRPKSYNEIDILSRRKIFSD